MRPEVRGLQFGLGPAPPLAVSQLRVCKTDGRACPRGRWEGRARTGGVGDADVEYRVTRSGGLTRPRSLGARDQQAAPEPGCAPASVGRFPRTLCPVGRAWFPGVRVGARPNRCAVE